MINMKIGKEYQKWKSDFTKEEWMFIINIIANQDKKKAVKNGYEFTCNGTDDDRSTISRFWKIPITWNTLEQLPSLES